MARLALALISVLPLLHAAHARQILFGASTSGSRCLGVRNPANDATTEVVDCYETGVHTDWTYTQPGDNKSVKLTGTNFCLDAGTNPHNNGPAKVYTCYPGTAAQHWYFTGDKRLAITGGDQCLDLDTSSTGRPQTYACTPGNTNQVWTPGAVLTSEPPVPPTTTIVTSTTLSTTPSTTPAPTATGKVQVLHPHSAPSQCLRYSGIYEGAYVYVGDCGSTEYPSDFLIKHGDNAAIYVPGTNLCLTGNGDQERGQLTISYCRTDAKTHFYYTDDQRLAVTGGTTCLDYGDDITPGYATPLEFLKCKTGDANQIFQLEDVQPSFTTTAVFPDPTTICHIGQQQILKPIAGANLTAKYPTGKVPFQYCSAQYFKTSTTNITVYLASATSKNPTKDGVVVGKSSVGGGFEYDITLTIPKGTKPAAKSQLFVLEYISGWVSEPTTNYTEAVLL